MPILYCQLCREKTDFIKTDSLPSYPREVELGTISNLVCTSCGYVFGSLRPKTSKPDYSTEATLKYWKTRYGRARKGELRKRNKKSRRPKAIHSRV